MSSRILLIEDEPGLVLTVSDLLSNEGYEVETAADGETGLAKAVLGKFNLSTNGSGLTGVGAWENALANPAQLEQLGLLGLDFAAARTHPAMHRHRAALILEAMRSAGHSHAT